VRNYLGRQCWNCGSRNTFIEARADWDVEATCWSCGREIPLAEEEKREYVRRLREDHPRM